MAKKRKAGARQAAPKEDFSVQNTRFAADERFTDSEDEFEAGRDQILLDEAPEVKRRRRLEEQEADLQISDEEVLAYGSESADEDFDEDEYGEDEEDDIDKRAASKKSSNLRRRDAISPESEDGGKPQSDEEGMTGWGASKKDYYDADILETEADALEEEEEAKKIQMKRLQSMAEADFGFDETEWATAGKEDETEGRAKDGGALTEVLPGLQVTDDMSSAERLKILKQRYPEFEPLSKDFTALQPLYKELLSSAKAARSQKSPKSTLSITPTALPTIQFRALSAYLGAISMYFFLLTSTSKNGTQSLAMGPAELREHPVMEALVNCRKQWEEVRGIELPNDLDAESGLDEESDEPVAKQQTVSIDPKKSSLKAANGKAPKDTAKKTKAEKEAEKAKALAEDRRAQKLRQTEDGLAELSKLLEKNQSKKVKLQPRAKLQQDDDSDFGDETGLTAQEAEEKAKKRKSLRFYTSQIAQKANKRGAAGRDAGGDADLPYRERLRDRQERLNLQAEKRGHQKANELEELGGDSDEDDYRVAREMRNDGGAGTDDDEYYDMVAARNKEKKDNKKKLAAAQAEAARAGGQVEIQEEIGPDGKRAITYAIEKNKGLAPKRNKDVRNPRVKKRKKFEEKKKKLGSIRQLYKGGEGRGGYAGELTGIKKNLVKSVKL